MKEKSLYQTMLIATLLLAAAWAGLVFSMGNEALFLYINANWTPSLGQPARFFSLLGESWAMGLALIISLRLPFRNTLLIGLTWLSGALHSWLFKLWLCKGWPRPFEYYSQKQQMLNLAEGVKVHHWNTFPSGHTITAFSLAVILPLIFPSMRRWQATIVLLVALLCGLSRIVLVQHWPQDVLGGMLLGCSAAFLSIRLMDFMPAKVWLEQSLIFRFRR